MQDTPLPTDIPQKKQTEKCLIFIVNSLFISVFLFLSGRTDKVILNAENCKVVQTSSRNTAKSKCKQQSDSDVNSEIKI